MIKRRGKPCWFIYRYSSHKIPIICEISQQIQGTRFASSFPSLKMLHKAKTNFRRMFASNEQVV